MIRAPGLPSSRGLPCLPCLPGLPYLLAAALLALACAQLAWAQTPATAPTPAPEQPLDSVANPEPHQLLVMLRLPAPHYRPDASYGGRYNDDGGRHARHRTAAELASAHGLTLVEDWPMPMLGVDCYVMRYADGARAEQVLALLARDPRVAWAQPVSAYQGMGDGSDALYPTQPSASLWHLSELHRMTTGRNISVAVIDSGVDSRHPDLTQQIAVSENFVSTGSVPAEQHGTAVAGIIAARAGNGGIIGIAPEARLMALRACWQLPDRGTRCSSFTLAKALHFAIQQGARIINLSLSGPPDRLLDQLTDVALERGITVVGAIDPHASGATFPASHRGVLAVATLAPGLPPATLQAPGRDIPTTAPGARWQFVNGSSYAAAHVSGMAALLAQLQPGAGAERLRSLLAPADNSNAGTIDACHALARLTPIATAPERRSGAACSSLQ